MYNYSRSLISSLFDITILKNSVFIVNLSLVRRDVHTIAGISNDLQATCNFNMEVVSDRAPSSLLSQKTLRLFQLLFTNPCPFELIPSPLQSFFPSWSIYLISSHPSLHSTFSSCLKAFHHSCGVVVEQDQSSLWCFFVINRVLIWNRRAGRQCWWLLVGKVFMGVNGNGHLLL